MGNRLNLSGYGAPTNLTPRDIAAEEEVSPMGAEFSQPQTQAQPMAAPIQQPTIPVQQSPAQLQRDYLGSSAAKLVKGYDEARQAGEMVAEAEVGYADAQARALQQRAEQRQQEMAERAQLREQKQRELEISRGEELAADKEAGKSYWEDRSIGAKIGAAIAQGLGAYAAAMTGTQNFAQQTIQQAVEADAQQKLRKARLAKDRTQGVAAKYDTLLNDLKDESAVRDVILADNYAMARAELDKLGSKAKSREVQAKYQMARGELDMKISELYGSAAAKAAEAQLKSRETLVPTLGANATTKEGAAKLNELAAETNTAKNGLNRLLELSTKSGSSLTPTDRTEAETIASTVKGALRVSILGPGTVNDAERAILDRLVANPTAIFSLDSRNRKALNTLIQRLDVNLAEKAKAYGIDAFTPTTKSIGGRTFKQIAPNQWQEVK